MWRSVRSSLNLMSSFVMSMSLKMMMTRCFHRCLSKARAWLMELARRVKVLSMVNIKKILITHCKPIFSKPQLSLFRNGVSSGDKSGLQIIDSVSNS